MFESCYGEDPSKLIDDFIDELSGLRRTHHQSPVYRLYAKTNGEVYSMYKLNEYPVTMLGVLRKSIYDENPEVPSLILRDGSRCVLLT